MVQLSFKGPGLSMALCLLCHALFSQSAIQPIDTAAYDRRSEVTEPILISANGKYVLYTQRTGFQLAGTAHVRTPNGSWTLALDRVVPSAVFTKDSRQLLVLNHQRQLLVVVLGTPRIDTIADVGTFQLAGSNLVVYQRTDKPQSLFIRQSTGQTRELTSVMRYVLDAEKRSMLYATSSSGTELHHLSFADQKDRVLWRGDHIGQFAFHSSLRTIGVWSKAADNRDELLSIDLGNGRVTSLIQSPGGSKSVLTFDPDFLESGKGHGWYVQSAPQERPVTPAPENGSSVRLLSYHQPGLFYPAVPYDWSSHPSLCYVGGAGQPLVRLEDDSSEFILPVKAANYALVRSRPRPFPEETRPNDGLSLITLANGHRTHLPFRSATIDQDRVWLSGDEQYLVWYNPDSLHYFSYSIADGHLRNISRSIPQVVYDSLGRTIGDPMNHGVAGWVNNRHAILIYDAYDLWEVRYDTNIPAVNRTNGTGRRTQITFSLFGKGGDPARPPVIDPGEPQLLAGFNNVTKANSFWSMSRLAAEPKLLSTHDALLYAPRTMLIGGMGTYSPNTLIAPQKATSANRWIISQQTVDHSPNIYVTDDFVTFHQQSGVSDEQPSTGVNVRLLSWTLPNGHLAQGRLFTPKNFDSTHKYPVIFTYYTRSSNLLHEFLTPGWSAATIDIPTYISRGYLVWLPDIYYEPGKVGEGLMYAINTTADMIGGLPFVDSTKMALNGHSFGGFQTNYIVTHSQRFAAAVEVAGVANPLTAYVAVSGSGEVRAGFYELRAQGAPYGPGVTPWTHPERYLANSAVSGISRVTTPLLIVHGQKDVSVPFAQALEMYFSLKRAGKKVWMLEYPDEGHTILEPANSRDFTIRQMAFFDHYLKGEPMPEWMGPTR